MPSSIPVSNTTSCSDIDISWSKLEIDAVLCTSQVYSGSLCQPYLQTWQNCAGIVEAAVHVDSMVDQEGMSRNQRSPCNTWVAAHAIIAHCICNGGWHNTRWNSNNILRM